MNFRHMITHSLFCVTSFSQDPFSPSYFFWCAPDDFPFVAPCIFYPNFLNSLNPVLPVANRFLFPFLTHSSSSPLDHQRRATPSLLQFPPPFASMPSLVFFQVSPFFEVLLDGRSHSRPIAGLCAICFPWFFY